MKNVELEKIFLRVRQHLLTQGEAAMESFSCLYRTSDGRSCAVGCLISREAYDEEIEGNDVAVLRTCYPPVAKSIGFTGDEEFDDALEELLRRLQNLHDTGDPDKWKDDLDAVARQYGFTTPETAHV
jgi:hypothetical protein